MWILTGYTFCLTVLIVSVNSETFPQCVGKAKGVYTAGRNGCKSYTYCDGESSYESNCPSGLAFNSADGICDDPSNVQCFDEALEPPQPIPGSPFVPTVVCPSGATDNNLIYLPSPDSCSDYYMCYAGTPIPLTCAVDLHFNTLMQSCDLPQFANCKLIATVAPPTPGQSNGLSAETPTKPRPTPNGGTPTPIPTRVPISTASSPSTTTRPSTSVPTTTGKTTTKTQPTPSQKTPTTTPVPTRTTRPTWTDTTVRSTTPVWGPPSPSGSTGLPSTDSTTLPPTQTHPIPTDTTPTPTPTWSPTETTTAPATELSLTDLCLKQYTGSFAYPDNCHYYYRCINGMLNKQECPVGFGFDDSKKICTSTGCSSLN